MRLALALLLMLGLLVSPLPARDESWNVDHPPGPTHEVPIDTREGTWISLDVSPQGDRLVFDLLGDLYLLPIAGGQATPLTQGMAWDMQPRFSPDGKTVAFTSDRGGGDNLWTIGVDGTGLKQISKDDFRLVNSPAWTPDGQYLAGRKHFTGTRSLGAGEIWLYDKQGGDGLQMTKKANDQKDLGEPAFSPDGRYLYFSQDATAGSTFEYNKDSNTGIYAISRLDRETGEIERICGGPGGACRPTPAPDGKRLAFVKRIRGVSVLYLLDLVSGQEKPINTPLDRDMQETWAIHGVYPTMAWTRDSRYLVFWAGGTIHKLEVATGQLADIPFQVKSSRTVCEALRFPQQVAPARFPVRMLRWVQASPSGDRVVYQALGKLWIKELPNGTPRRLTRQSDHFEFYPSFSRDGQWIVYTTWNDHDLGSVRRVSSGGGEGEVITSHPGHYSEPVFSPDGRSVVYVQGHGGYLTSPLWSREPGIYRLDLGAPGHARRIHKGGSEPHFGARSDRVYFLTSSGETQSTLASVSLDGHDERQHVATELGTHFRVSPDGRWLAWTESYQAFRAPFPATGQRYDLGSKSNSLPVKQVSSLCGDYLSWSGDSKKLYWAWGPELFSCDPEHPVEHSQNIGFEAGQDVPEQTLALVGGRIITMRGDEVVEHGTVVVRGNRLVAVGPSQTTPVPPEAWQLDVSGKTIIPGLVDVHWHGPMSEDQITPQQSWVNLASLTFGVTTLHDPSNDSASIFSAAELQRTGAILAPRIFSTGTVLYGAKADIYAPINSLAEARTHVKRQQSVGAISVKSYNQPRRDQRQQVIAAARELKMLVVPEGGSLLMHNLTQVVDGHTGVEHSVPVARVYQDVVQLWSGTQSGYTPTLGVAYGGIMGENYWYDKTDVWEHPRLSHYVPRQILDQHRRRIKAPEEEYNHLANSREAHRLAQAGVKVNLGAHGQREGLAAHWELWMLVQGGMTPLEALRCATLNGAHYLGMDGDIGSLEVGKLADLAVLDADPLADIRQSDRVHYVMANGRLFEAESMNEIGPHPHRRAPFYFEEQP